MNRLLRKALALRQARGTAAWAILVLTGVVPVRCLAHSQAVHQEITQSAALSSGGLQRFLYECLGPQSSYQDRPLLRVINLPGKTDILHSPIDWLRIGSFDEDEGGLQGRAQDHFYSVTSKHSPGKVSGLSDGSELPGILDNGTTNSYEWATKRNAPGPLYTTRASNSVAIGPNLYSWPYARDFQYECLTNALPADRTNYLGAMLCALGHVLHLNQDLSDPEHVRNDERALQSSRIEHYGQWVYWVNAVTNNGQQYPAYFPLMPHGWAYWQAQGFAKLLDFWDRGKYTNGSVNALNADARRVTGAKLGLAEYSNGNFLAEDASYFQFLSSGSHYFPQPSLPNTTEPQLKVGLSALNFANLVLDNNSSGDRVYLSKVNAGDVVAHHSAVHYLDVLNPKHDDLPATKANLTVNDTNVLQDYHQIMIPKAIEYSAGVLDYFFRGQLATYAFRGCSDNVIQLSVTNISGQTLSGGTLELFADGPDGTRKKVYSLHPVWQPGDTLRSGASRQFCFCDPDSTTTSYMLVYRGSIGTDPIDNTLGIATGQFLPPPAVPPIMLTVYSNTTSVPDYCPTGTVISPYIRPNGGESGTQVTDCGTIADCGGVGQPGCGMMNPFPSNTFGPTIPATNVVVPTSTTNKIGFKNVIGMKAWSGIFGPKSTMWNPIRKMNGDGSCEEYQGSIPTPDTTKYRTLTAVATYTSIVHEDCPTEGGDPTYYTSETCVRSSSIDRYTGHNTINGSDTSNIGSVEDAAALFGNTFWNIGGLGDTYAIYQAALYDLGTPTQSGFGSTPSATVSAEWDGANTNWLTETASANLIAGTVNWTLDATSVTPPDGSGDLHHSFTITLTDTSFTYTEIYNQDTYGDCGGYTRLTNQLTVLYSDPYTSDDVNADVNAALATWNLSDDIQYPWRQDTQVSHGPLVTYNERGPIKPNFSMYPTTDSTPPPHPDITDGGIVGAPLPRNVSLDNPNGVIYSPGYFDFTFQNWTTCFDYETFEIFWYIQSFGGYAPSYCPFATQWVNEHDATVLPQGAFEAYNCWAYPDPDGEGDNIGFAGDYLVKAKYAEVLLPVPGHNFARPGGRDRYVYDSPSVRYISSTGHGIVTLDTNQDGGDPQIYSTNTSMVLGTMSAVDGLYHATDAYPIYCLGTQLSGVPPAITTGDKYFGKLRWPDAPGIRGRLSIRAVGPTSNGQIGITVDGIHWLQNGDQVSISGCANSQANGIHTITWLDDHAFALNYTVTTNTSPAGGYVHSVTNPTNRWQFDNGSSKGNWSLLTWQYNYRDLGERARLLWETNGYAPDCPTQSVPGPIRTNTLALTNLTMAQYGNANAAPCSRPIVVISPNAEGPFGSCTCETSYTNAMANLTCDENYGSLWQSIPKQWMQDPLWQPPPPPRNSDPDNVIIDWVEDDGTGQEDTSTTDPDTGLTILTKYYPLRPLEECVSAVPSGAPPMPTNTYVGTLTVAQENTTPLPAGQFFWPPVGNAIYGVSPDLPMPPWMIFLNKRGDIERRGRFSCE